MSSITLIKPFTHAHANYINHRGKLDTWNDLRFTDSWDLPPVEELEADLNSTELPPPVEELEKLEADFKAMEIEYFNMRALLSRRQDLSRQIAVKRLRDIRNALTQRSRDFDIRRVRARLPMDCLLEVRSYLLGDYKKTYTHTNPYGLQWAYNLGTQGKKFGFEPKLLDFIRMATICKSIKTARLINRMKAVDILWLSHHCGNYGVVYIADGILSKDSLAKKKNKIIANLKKLAGELELGQTHRSMELWNIIKNCYKRHKDANRLSLDLPAKNWATKYLTIEDCDE